MRLAGRLTDSVPATRTFMLLLVIFGGRSPRGLA